jgi:coenzyme PQQ precursor peptide PqqA
MTQGLSGARLPGDDSAIVSSSGPAKAHRQPKEFVMTQWIKPQATDLRYGFEITMYISNR